MSRMQLSWQAVGCGEVELSEYRNARKKSHGIRKAAQTYIIMNRKNANAT